ncbi:hypothetical protein [Methanobrevibacter boviskoreani]|uniref:hypothetical protein n=1 Tax=Methanobrevibacter boviskoreani TaxID=1348249 RepID=UPI0023A88D1E|nr:hypothetical protein [Methanobrevibacter boviskoreani]MCI6774245.1 hypothetical protein [Methanobrevibacter boviskoreani]MCI6931210.1 hypothetical protein [Methanobrevibacter boviskoreani]
MSDLTPEEFDKKADDIYKRISNKRMADIKRIEMKYNKEFKKFDKYFDNYLEDELNQMEKRIKSQYELNKIREANKLRKNFKF